MPDPQDPNEPPDGPDLSTDQAAPEATGTTPAPPTQKSVGAQILSVTGWIILMCAAFCGFVTLTCGL